MRSSEAFTPFGEYFFSALASSVQERLTQAVGQVATTPETNLADHTARLPAQFAIEPLDLDIENASRSERSETATAEQFDFYSGRNAGESYTRQVVTIHVPFTGEPDLFRCHPLTRTHCTRPVWLAGTELCFDVPMPTHGPFDLKGEVQRMLSCLQQNTTCLAQEIAQFNHSLVASATKLLAQKQAEASERSSMLDSLGLPPKKADAATATSSAPARRTETPAPKPPVGVNIFNHAFRLAFSFPGEARHRIRAIAEIVQGVLGPDTVFYDEWYKAELARPNLDLNLQSIYSRAELIIPCLCDGYQTKEWCGLEWRAIRELIKRRQDRIMFLRLDDSEVAGSFSLDGYIDLRKHDDEETGALVLRRVTGARSELAPTRPMLAAAPQADAVVAGSSTDYREALCRDLVIEITDAGHGFAIRLRNDGLLPVDDCRITLERLDRYIPGKHDFTRNPFEPMTVLKPRKVQGGGTSDGFVFVTWDPAYGSLIFHADIPEQRSAPSPELTGADIWIAEFKLYQADAVLNTKTIFVALSPRSKPALVDDPRVEVQQNGTPFSRFAQLKNRHVRLTPVLPIARAQDKFFVREVNSEAIELEKSSGHVISIPAHRITDDFPAPADSDGTRLLELNGRLQWLSLSRTWRFLPEKPQSPEERQYGFFRAAAPEDPLVIQLQQRGKNVRFARPDNLPRYLLQGYQLVYDEAGLYLKRGGLLLIAEGV
jgi:hypothetical protein